MPDALERHEQPFLAGKNARFCKSRSPNFKNREIKTTILFLPHKVSLETPWGGDPAESECATCTSEKKVLKIDRCVLSF